MEPMIGEQKAQGTSSALRRHPRLAHPLLLVICQAETHTLPFAFVGGTKLPLPHHGAQTYYLQRPLLLRGELQHTLAQAVLQQKLTAPIPGPSDAFTGPRITVCSSANSRDTMRLTRALDRDAALRCQLGERLRLRTDLLGAEIATNRDVASTAPRTSICHTLM